MKSKTASKPAPPKPPIMRVGCNGNPCPLCGSGMKAGWDLYEEQTRQEFEYYAVRRGYSVVRDSDYSFFYAEERTERAWEMYHQGHVKGRTWSE